jgi:hypothetical protein
MRWPVEVTFEEVRRHLGVERQRQWSDLAIARTTPVLLGLFSLITLFADRLNSRGELLTRRSAWYAKPLPTFSDAIAAARTQIWPAQLSSMSPLTHDTVKVPLSLFQRLTDTLVHNG